MSDAPYEIPLTEAIKLQRELLQAGVEVAHWLNDILTDKTPLTVYKRYIGEVHENTILTIGISNVDDEGKFRFDGIGKVASLNGSASANAKVRGKGRKAIVFECTNTGAHRWNMNQRVSTPNDVLVNFEDGGDDSFYYHRKRVYIYEFTSV